MQLFFCYAFLEDHLNESTATSSGNEFSIHKIFAYEKDLVNASIRCSGVQHTGQFPMLVQKLSEFVDISLLQSKAHQNCNRLHFLQCFQGFWSASDITADHIAQKVSCKTSLSSVDQSKSLLQLFLAFFRHLNLLNNKILSNSRLCRNQFNPFSQSADLILPSASGTHNLLHSKDNVIDFRIRPI